MKKRIDKGTKNKLEITKGNILTLNLREISICIIQV